MTKEKKFDLHIHTNFSDGISSPEEVVRYAKKIGLDGIAITDHDTVKGMKKAEKLAKKLNIELVPGLEITTSFGDILALGIKEVINGFNADLKGVMKIIDDIHKKGGIAVAAHPYAGVWPAGSFAENIDKLDFDAIEIFNANCSLEANIKAMELAKKTGITGTAGSDAHSLDMVGTAFTITKNGLIESIKKGKVKIGWL